MKQSLVIAALIGLVQLRKTPNEFMQFDHSEGSVVVRNTPYGTVLMMQDEKNWDGWKEEDDYELVQRKS